MRKREKTLNEVSPGTIPDENKWLSSAINTHNDRQEGAKISKEHTYTTSALNLNSSS